MAVNPSLSAQHQCALLVETEMCWCSPCGNLSVRHWPPHVWLTV